MEFKDIREFTATTSSGSVRFLELGLANGRMLLITDADQFRLGVSAIAIPPGPGRTEPTSTGFYTMGLDTTLVRTMAERIALWTNQTCMIISGVRNLNRQLMMELTSVLRDHLVT
ncbi:hypothetical protein EU545_03535 [Candidatus Thorarchaeota archaeon]|jgi:hypothetical protein|nr:MAG: hypothetical protein EU545_03535 [Candidatus Thorarchaeota archaeon]